MALNRLEWTQKEQFIDYHVLRWPTSHLHPGTRRSVSDGFELREQAKGAGTAGERASQQEGIGLGLADRPKSGRWRSGGLGSDGMAYDGLKQAADDRDGLTLSTHQSGRQATGMMQDVAAIAAQDAVVQAAVSWTASPDAAQSAAHSFAVGQTLHRAGNRMREIIGRLRDIYLKQRKKAESPQRQGRSARPQKERQGTRLVSREEVLSMQAENHYLLDSYDKNGQYSTLGKEKF